MPMPYVKHLCTAFLKRRQRVCHNPAVRGSTKCRNHGGLSLRGMAAPNYRTGLYSRTLPVNLAARLQLGQKDPQLLHLRTEIGLLDARLSQLMERLQSGESRKRTRLLHRLLRQALQSQNDPTLLNDLLRQMHSLLTTARGDYDVWDEVDRKLELRVKLVEAERRRLVDAHQILTIEQLMSLLGRVYHIIVKNVPDRNTQSRISREIKVLIDAEGPDADAIEIGPPRKASSS